MWCTTGLGIRSETFILYTNDICNVSDFAKLVLFADDTNIFKSGSDFKVLLSIELDKLQIWFDVNKLSLNVLKRILWCSVNVHAETNFDAHNGGF